MEQTVHTPGGIGTILVAEDQEIVRKVVVATLERAGYMVLVAENGREAVRLMAERPEGVSLLLMDVLMPELSGTEAYEQIAQAHPDIPVLFMSGQAESSLNTDGLPANTGIISKPFRGPGLLERIRSVLEAQ